MRSNPNSSIIDKSGRARSSADIWEAFCRRGKRSGRRVTRRKCHTERGSPGRRPSVQRLDDVTLSASPPADQDQVIAAPDEIAAGQFFDLHAVEGFGVELPVEPFQGLAVRKTGFPNAPRDGAFPARVGLCPQQQIEKVQRERETLFLRPEQQLVQPCTFQRNPQSRAVTQTPVTQRGRRLRRFHRGSPFLPIAADTPPWNEWIRETAGGSRRVAPARRPAAIPIRTGGELAPPVWPQAPGL